MKFILSIAVTLAAASASAHHQFIHCEKAVPFDGFQAKVNGVEENIYNLNFTASDYHLNEDYPCQFRKVSLKENYDSFWYGSILDVCEIEDEENSKKFTMSRRNRTRPLHEIEMEVIDGERITHIKQSDGQFDGHAHEYTFAPGECVFPDSEIISLTNEPQVILLQAMRSADRIDSTKIVWNDETNSWNIGFYGQSTMYDSVGGCYPTTENCQLGTFGSIYGHFNFWHRENPFDHDFIYVGDLNPIVDIDGDGILEQLTVTAEKQVINHGRHDDDFLWVKVTAQKIQ